MDDIQEFRCDRPIAMSLIVVLPLIFFGSLVISDLGAAHFSGETLCAVGATVVYAWIMLSYFIGMSNVRVSDLDVSRRWLGITWQSICWKDVKFIQVQDVPDPRFSLPQKRVVMFGRVHSVPLLGRRKGMVLPSRMLEPLAMMGGLNRYVSLHGIGVEKVANGATVRSDTI